jgi:S1-C subfamily serine protease
MDDRRVTYGALIFVSILTLITGAIAGALAGTLAGKSIVDDNPVVAAGVATAVVRKTPTPNATAEGTAGSSGNVSVDGSPVITNTEPTPTMAVPLAAPDANAASASVIELVDRVNPSVVTVINKMDFSGFTDVGADLQPVGMGTGFIISQDGYLVTNNHVVEGSSAIDIIFADGSKVPGTLIGTDAFTDLAVVKVDVPVPAVVPLGDSNALRSGEQVVAIGSALGTFSGTVTDGVISGLNRRLDNGDGSSMENMIQHDAPINPGNSGGPLLNMRGEVVGVNTAAIRNAGDGRYVDGMGFAVSSATVQNIVTILIANGSVSRPYMGLSYFPLNKVAAEALELPVSDGIMVTIIPSESPAADAGIQKGDIITKIDGQAIDATHPFVNLLYQYQPGDTTQVEFIRPGGNETMIVPVTLAIRPDIP